MQELVVASLNWRRGLLRAWVVLAVTWAALAFAFRPSPALILPVTLGLAPFAIAFVRKGFARSVDLGSFRTAAVFWAALSVVTVCAVGPALRSDLSLGGYPAVLTGLVAVEIALAAAAIGVRFAVAWVIRGFQH